MAFPTKIPLFRRFVLQNFPFIEQDFDALTDYQLICKVVEYLNKVIEVTNETTGQVELLTTAFTQLKDYVDHYFDNLDVQEEINNKLDEMAEDGTLQEIITAYIQANVAWTFDTVADMKSATNLVNGSYARTLGYHAINDGGGALYKITDNGTANEMDVIAIGLTLFATLIVPTVVTPEIYGAYGDGTHNDKDAIQRAIDQNRCVTMTKDYLINSSVYIGNQDASGSLKNNINLYAGGSTVTYSGNGNAFVIAGIREGNIEFGKITASSGNCIEMWSTNGNVSIAYLNVTFKELRPASTGKAFYIHTSATGFINQNKFNGGVIFSGAYGFYIEQNPTSGSYRMNGNEFNRISFEGCDICYSLNSLSQSMRGFRFNNDRTVENLHTKWIEVIGTIEDFIWNTWSRTNPTKIDYTNGTLKFTKIIAPLWNSTTNKYEGSGLYIDNANKKYLFEGYSTKTLTKEAGVTGTVLIIHTGNNYILNFVTLGVDSQNKTLVLASNNPLTPNRRYYGTITNTAGNTAKITLENTGEIKLSTSETAASTTFDGQLIFDSFSPESI